MQRVIPKIKEFPNDGRIWRVDWFGGVERNEHVPTEPKIQIIISPLVDGATDYAASKAVDHEARTAITIGVGQLPLVTIGSLWQHRRCLSLSAGKTKFFSNLHISSDTVQLIRSDAVVEGDQLIRKLFHRIGVGLAANCLAVEWQNDPYGIIIPVAEIIRFYYTTSTDLAKAIFAGDFRHNLGAIVNSAESGFDDEERRAYLKLRKEYSDMDAWIIARVLFSPDAFAGATLVHDSMMKEAVLGKPRVYPHAAFPFSGKTTLKVRGKPMQAPDGVKWRFIVFGLEYCTGAFPFDSITCDRDNNNLRAPGDIDLPNDEKETAFPGGCPRPLVQHPINSFII